MPKEKISIAQKTQLAELWQAGISSGSAGILDIEEIKREARQRYAIPARPCLATKANSFNEAP